MENIDKNSEEADRLLEKHNGDFKAARAELALERGKFAYKSKAKRVMAIKDVQSILYKRENDIAHEKHRVEMIRVGKQLKAKEIIEKRLGDIYDSGILEELAFELMDRHQEVTRERAMQFYADGEFAKMNREFNRTLLGERDTI